MQSVFQLQTHHQAIKAFFSLTFLHKNIFNICYPLRVFFHGCGARCPFGEQVWTNSCLETEVLDSLTAIKPEVERLEFFG